MRKAHTEFSCVHPLRSPLSVHYILWFEIPLSARFGCFWTTALFLPCTFFRTFCEISTEKPASGSRAFFSNLPQALRFFRGQVKNPLAVIFVANSENPQNVRKPLAKVTRYGIIVVSFKIGLQGISAPLLPLRTTFETKIKIRRQTHESNQAERLGSCF